ncbi:MAG: hypothetical protein ACI3VX_04915 [Faecousia sp.]
MGASIAGSVKLVEAQISAHRSTVILCVIECETRTAVVIVPVQVLVCTACTADSKGAGDRCVTGFNRQGFRGLTNVCLVLRIGGIVQIQRRIVLKREGNNAVRFRSGDRPNCSFGNCCAVKCNVIAGNGRGTNRHIPRSTGCHCTNGRGVIAGSRGADDQILAARQVVQRSNLRKDIVDRSRVGRDGDARKHGNNHGDCENHAKEFFHKPFSFSLIMTVRVAYTEYVAFFPPATEKSNICMLLRAYHQKKSPNVGKMCYASHFITISLLNYSTVNRNVQGNKRIKTYKFIHSYL